MTLPMDHYYLLAQNYYSTTLLVGRAVEVLCFLLQAKPSGLPLFEGQWRSHTDRGRKREPPASQEQVGTGAPQLPQLEEEEGFCHRS